MDGFFKEDLLERLARLDEEADLLFDDDRRFRMVIVGGSALILLETITRATHDIDALDVSPEIADLLEKYDINTRVGTFINNFPYNYDERLEYLATAEDEAKASALNEFRYAEFLDSYRTYVRRWRDCENSLSEGFSLSM